MSRLGIIFLALIIVQCYSRRLEQADGVLIQRLKRSYDCDPPRFEQPHWPPPPLPPPPPAAPHWPLPPPPPPPPRPPYWSPPPPPHHHHHHHHHQGLSEENLERFIEAQNHGNNGVPCDTCNKNAAISNSLSVNGNAIAVAVSKANGKK